MMVYIYSYPTSEMCTDINKFLQMCRTVSLTHRHHLQWTHPTRLRVQAASRAKQRLRHHRAGLVKGNFCVFISISLCASKTWLAFYVNAIAEHVQTGIQMETRIWILITFDQRGVANYIDSRCLHSGVAPKIHMQLAQYKWSFVSGM